MIGVVAHDVPLLGHAHDQIGGGLDHMAHHKEGCRGLVLGKDIQNPAGVPVLIAAVKGEVDHLFLRVSQIAGVVPRQLLLGGVAHGRGTLLRKGEPPVVR